MNAQHEIVSLPLNQLRIDDKANVRKIGRGTADKDFVASIESIGIRVPLIVRKNGTGYIVADGGKRLEAAQALAKAGKLAVDAPIPAIVTEASDNEARELSLTLNVIRADMHPVDAFRAFSELNTDAEKPFDVDAIAARFGMPTKRVNQILALGALDEKVLNAWRDGTIKESDAQAFTLCTDKKEQARILAKLTKSHELYAGEIRREITKDQRNVGIYVDLIGAEAYAARGGKIVRDLFGTNHVVSDAALLQTMVAEKLAEKCKALVADGWKWATSELPENQYLYGYGRLRFEEKPTRQEAKRLKDLAEQIENEELDDEVREKASDELDALNETIQMRSITPAQKATAGCFVQLGREGSIVIDYGRIEPKTVASVKGETSAKAKVKAKDDKPKGPAVLTQATTDRLNEAKRSALKAALVAHPHHPLAAVLAGIVASQIKPESRWNWAPDQIAQKIDTLMDGIEPKIMNAALRKTFDAKAYFDGCGKSFCLAAITEAVNADEARKVSGKKRGEIAAFALANVGKTGWLPKQLRTSHYDGPTGAKTSDKKGKAKSKTKAASTKAPARKRAR